MIKGLDKLTAQLKSIKEVDKGKALLAGAFTLQKYSMENTPVKTGFLRNSHESRQTGDGAEVRVNANYAFYVEFGTSRMGAKPFIRPAMDEHMQEIVNAVAEQVEKDIQGKI
jgi:HK97 gp10 family phage protein